MKWKINGNLCFFSSGTGISPKVDTRVAMAHSPNVIKVEKSDKIVNISPACSSIHSQKYKKNKKKNNLRLVITR